MPQRTNGEPPESTPPPEWLSITYRKVTDVLVVEVIGEVDLQAAPALLKAMKAAIDHVRPDCCIIDLTMVTFLGAAGLTALLGASRHNVSALGPRWVVNGTSPVIRPIKLTGLDDSLKLYHSIDEALHSVL